MERTALYIGDPAGNCDEFNRRYEVASGGFAAMFVEPKAPNRRQALQSGLFLVGLDLTNTLEESLYGCVGYPPTDLNPSIGEDGRPTEPVGFYTSPLGESARTSLTDALVDSDLAGHPDGRDQTLPG